MFWKSSEIKTLHSGVCRAFQRTDMARFSFRKGMLTPHQLSTLLDKCINTTDRMQSWGLYVQGKHPAARIHFSDSVFELYEDLYTHRFKQLLHKDALSWNRLLHYREKVFHPYYQLHSIMRKVKHSLNT